MEKFEDLVPEERAQRPSRRTIPASMLRDACCALRARHERPRSRAAEQRDQLATFHCPMSPVLPTERIPHPGGAGDLLRCGISVPSMSALGHSRPRPAKPKGYTRPLRPKGGQTHKRLAKSALCHDVWPGRAVQDGLPRSTNVRAASMYQASEVEQFAPGHHGYPRASEAD
jgi:hypothetical protein